MKTAILSDIHGNRAAFEAVLADVALRGADRLVILGDIVGYGPDPEWCAARTMELAAAGAVVVQGNHDAAVGRPQHDLRGAAQAAIDWTRPRLPAAARDYLAALPLTAVQDGVFLVHASPNDPSGWIYVSSPARAVGAFRACAERLILCGHLHVPRLMSIDSRGYVGEHAVRPGFGVPLLPSRRWLAVVGAVGQPRDGSPQAAYAIHDAREGTLAFRRVAYDIAATTAKLRAAGLPEALALRLERGS